MKKKILMLLLSLTMIFVFSSDLWYGDGLCHYLCKFWLAFPSIHRNIGSRLVLLHRNRAIRVIPAIPLAKEAEYDIVSIILCILLPSSLSRWKYMFTTIVEKPVQNCYSINGHWSIFHKNEISEIWMKRKRKGEATHAKVEWYFVCPFWWKNLYQYLFLLNRKKMRKL